MIILVILILSKGGCWISVTNIGAWPLSYMKTRGGGEGWEPPHIPVGQFFAHWATENSMMKKSTY